MRIFDLIKDGPVDPVTTAALLRTSTEELARTLGLGKEALHRQPLISVEMTQRRLREFVAVLNEAELRFGSVQMAYAWYRVHPLIGFNGLTAMQLVQDGKTLQVMKYIAAVDAGVFA